MITIQKSIFVNLMIEKCMDGNIGVDFLLIKQILRGQMFLQSLVKLNNFISFRNFAPKFK